jgi:hypothetical protein
VELHVQLAEQRAGHRDLAECGAAPDAAAATATTTAAAATTPAAATPAAAAAATPPAAKPAADGPCSRARLLGPDVRLYQHEQRSGWLDRELQLDLR